MKQSDTDYLLIREMMPEQRWSEMAIDWSLVLVICLIIVIFPLIIVLVNQFLHQCSYRHHTFRSSSITSGKN